MFRIAFTPQAIGDLDDIHKHAAARIVAEVERQLSSEPTSGSRNRKRLRPNRIGEWELRVGEYRVFYNVEVDERVVRVLAVGAKMGNRLFIRGQRYDL